MPTESKAKLPNPRLPLVPPGVARLLVPLLPVVLLSGCKVPPPEAYTSAGGRGRPTQSVDLGQNEVGEACVQAAGSTKAAEVYCGSWQQPSARVRSAGPATQAGLMELAGTGSWRTNLDANYLCSAPQPSTLGGVPAVRLDCTRRVGGWPHVAVAALADGQAWLADGVVSALPAMARSVAVLSGRERAVIVSSAATEALQAQRQGARARASGDPREFDSLMLQGARANLADNPAAAAEAYGAALALQEKALGADNPNVADPAMHLALQLSIQGNYAEADTLFARAERLAAGQQGDATIRARLLHYEGLHAWNQGRGDGALDLLRRAEAGYLAALPLDALKQRADAGAGGRRSMEASLGDALATPLQRQTRMALSGLVEVRRYQGVVLREQGRLVEANAAVLSAAEAARNGGLERPEVLARLMRTSAVGASLSGNQSQAISAFRDSSSAFALAYPGSRPLALIGLLRARELVQVGQPEAAVPVCRDSVKVLLEIKSSFEPERMTGCLDAFYAAAGKAPEGPARQGLLREMFQAAQLVRSSATSQQIQQASARLSAGGAGSKVGDAIRSLQDAAGKLADIRRRRELAAQAARDGTASPADAKALDQEEQGALSALAGQEATLQAAAPNYSQLVQQAIGAEDVLRALAPGTAFAAVTLTAEGGWTFLLRDGGVRVGRVPGGTGAVDPLVLRIRAVMKPDVPAFDTAASQALYKAVFGEVAAGLDGVRALTVAPMGSLLSLPFGVLLTGPANPDDLAGAPWLLRRMAVGHVPSASNFAALARLSGGSRAPRPWFGFGDFRPVSFAQAQRSFPPSCGNSAELMARLPPLPSAKRELEAARRLLGGGTGEELLGQDFTAPAAVQADLGSYRVLHFATHALLPSDLRCLTEPALIASAPKGAPDAAGALLKASDLAQVKLDADVVILSACNSGGADGKLGGGEGLSALARSFFYGGARSLLITHWEVNDQAAAFLVADTLRRFQAQPAGGVAGALRAAQVGALDEVGKSLPAEFGHPFYWAPFALIGLAMPAPSRT